MFFFFFQMESGVFFFGVTLISTLENWAQLGEKRRRRKKNKREKREKNGSMVTASLIHSSEIPRGEKFQAGGEGGGAGY